MQRSTHLTKPAARINPSASRRLRSGLGETRYVYLLSVPYDAQSQNRDRLVNVLKSMDRVEVVERQAGSGRPPSIKISSTQSKDSGLLQTLAQAARDRVQAAGQEWSLALMETTDGNGSGSGSEGNGAGDNQQIVSGVSNTTLFLGVGAAATGVLALAFSG